MNEFKNKEALLPECFMVMILLCWGIASILDAVRPSAFVPVLQQTELDANAEKLRNQEYDLILAEIEYDKKTFRVWKKRSRILRYVVWAWRMIGWWNAIQLLNLLWIFTWKRRLGRINNIKQCFNNYLNSIPGAVSGLEPVSHLSPDLQVSFTTWPEKFGTGSAAHGVVTDMLSDLRKDMGDWMKHRKLSKQVSWESLQHDF